MPKTLPLKEGDAAPLFTTNTGDGQTLSLADLRGKHVILYFYPRDNTPGCTKEACAFRDEFAALKKKGAVVLGVSADSLTSHSRFVQKYKLPFTLLSDADNKIGIAYGAWGPKQFMGIRYTGMHRITFLIAPDGTIKRIWTKVKPADHAREILAQL
jgi:peroxiredoxin Q/BCP